LHLYGTQITEISALAGLTNLLQLNLSENQVTDISPLAGLINLEELHVWVNQITDISPLVGLSNLERLRLGRNQITDISPLLAGLDPVLWKYGISSVRHAKPCEFRGKMWHDINGNGTLDADEPGLQRWTIYVDMDGNGSLDAGEPNQTTDANGDYALTARYQSTHTIAALPKAGWEQTFPSTGVHTVVLGSGQIVSNVDFGNRELHDPNGDGESDHGEPALPDWMIILEQSESDQAGEQAAGKELHVVGDSRTLDLTSIAENEFPQIDAVNIVGSGANTLILDREAVLNVSDAANQLRVLADHDDTVTIGEGWSFVGTQVDGDDFFRVLQQDNATLLMSGPRHWQNPQSQLDSNFSRAIEPADALVIIDMLNGAVNGHILRFGEDQLVDPITLDVFPDIFPDTNGDGVGSPLDALLVINFLNNRMPAAEGEYSLAAPTVMGPNRVVDPVDLVFTHSLIESQRLPSHDTSQTQPNQVQDVARRSEQDRIWPAVSPYEEQVSQVQMAPYRQRASELPDETSVDLLLGDDATLDSMLDQFNEA